MHILFSDCYSYEEADKCTARNGTYYRQQCYLPTDAAAASDIMHQAEQAIRRPPAEEYFS
jgi:hypothetical protein